VQPSPMYARMRESAPRLSVSSLRLDVRHVDHPPLARVAGAEAEVGLLEDPIDQATLTAAQTATA
jgi:hypothetical protein